MRGLRLELQGKESLIRAMEDQKGIQGERAREVAGLRAQLVAREARVQTLEESRDTALERVREAERERDALREELTGLRERITGNDADKEGRIVGEERVLTEEENGPADPSACSQEQSKRGGDAEEIRENVENV